MHTYCKLKDGTIMVLYSDNVEKETMHLYDLEELEDFDAEFLTTTEHPYTDIVRTDISLENLK